MTVQCVNCGLPIFQGAFGYVGQVCQCHWQTRQPNQNSKTECKPLRQLTEDDVRRIVREELAKQGEQK